MKRILKYSGLFLLKNYFICLLAAGVGGSVSIGSAMVGIITLFMLLPTTLVNLLYALIVYKTGLSRRFIRDNSYIVTYSLMFSLFYIIGFGYFINNGSEVAVADTARFVTSICVVVFAVTFAVSTIVLYIIKRKSDWDDFDEDDDLFAE